MDTFGVVLNDVSLLAPVAQGGFVAGLVAIGAERRDVARERGRSRVVLAQGVVRAVASLAGGGVGAALGRQRAVGALVILVDLGLVTDGTIDLRRHGVAGPFVRRGAAGVALHAGDGSSTAAGRVMVDGGVQLGLV